MQGGTLQVLLSCKIWPGGLTALCKVSLCSHIGKTDGKNSFGGRQTHRVRFTKVLKVRQVTSSYLHTQVKRNMSVICAALHPNLCKSNIKERTCNQIFQSFSSVQHELMQWQSSITYRPSAAAASGILAYANWRLLFFDRPCLAFRF